MGAPYPVDDWLEYIISECVDGTYGANPLDPPRDHPMRRLVEMLVRNGLTPEHARGK